MLSSLFEIKSSLWNTKFMKGIKGSLSTGFSSVYYLYCQMQKSIKSFLQGLVLSQLIFPICIGHELLVLLPRPYVLKRCWLFLCMVFSHLGQSLSQGSASFLSSHSLQMNKNIIFQQDRNYCLLIFYMLIFISPLAPLFISSASPCLFITKDNQCFCLSKDSKNLWSKNL